MNKCIYLKKKKKKKERIKSDITNYNLNKFKLNISEILALSCHEEEELFSSDTFILLLRERFFEESIAKEFEDYFLGLQEKTFSITQSQLQEMINTIINIEKYLQNKEAIIEEVMDRFMKGKVFQNNIWGYFCESPCPLCRSPCFKRNDHEGDHDCFHYPGGLVGQYYRTTKDVVGKNIIHKRTIISQNYINQRSWLTNVGIDSFIKLHLCFSS